MLRSNTKLAVPFLCYCFWTIIFSVFISFYAQLVGYTNIKIDDGEVCSNIPIQNQYQWIKHKYSWQGIENITDIVLRQDCPDSQISTKVYAGNSYLGGTSEINTNTFILNCWSETLYTISNSTLYDHLGKRVGLFNFDTNCLLLETMDGQLIARWYFDSHALTLSVTANSITTKYEPILLFSIAGKYAFGGYNECATRYWMALQIVIISGILGLASIVAVCIALLKHQGKDAAAYRYSRKTINLKPFNKK